MAEGAGPRKHAGSCSVAAPITQSDTGFGMDDSLLGGPFEFVSYQEVDVNQRAEFEALLKKVSVSVAYLTPFGWHVSSLHIRAFSIFSSHALERKEHWLTFSC